MKWHYESVSKTLLDVLRMLQAEESLADFRLVGGTALSLQRGHRRSIDIDLFTDLPYGKMPTKRISAFLQEAFPIHKEIESLQEEAIGYHVWVGDGIEPPIKVDLFYTDDFIFPCKEADGLRMADEREIAAMKLQAIAGPIKRQKDYWDIHELLQAYSLTEMIEWCLLRHPYTLTEEDIIAGLLQIDSVEESPEGIDSLHILDYWELKVLDLKEVTNALSQMNKSKGNDKTKPSSSSGQ